MNLQGTLERINTICSVKKWDKSWKGGGCYLHLESSELIEALRGKGDSSPAEEAGDVVFALLALLGNYGIPLEDVFANLDRKLRELESECTSQSNTSGPKIELP